MLRPRLLERSSHRVRPRARQGRVAGAVPRPVVVALTAALLVGTAGCGSEEEAQADEPSKAAQECRDQWNALGGTIAEREDHTNPSALAERWSSISAAVEHYRAAAEADDCGTTLKTEKKGVEDLSAFSARLARFDMELRLAQVADEARRYASGPRPPAPEPDKAKKGEKRTDKAQQKRPPKPSEVSAALKTLTRQAPRATEQQGPGWQQALAVDLDDARATKKAVKDLKFLSEESKAYHAASSALGTIRRALAAKQG